MPSRQKSCITIKQTMSNYTGTHPEYVSFRLRVGLATDTISSVARQFDVNKWFVDYWRKKFLKSAIWFGNWGGTRKTKFILSEQASLEAILFLVVQQYPLATLNEFTVYLKEYDFDVNRMFLSRIFKKWRWSFKRPSVKQWHKYKPENLIYYSKYVHAIKDIPWCKLKYFDETHCRPRGKLKLSSN